MAALGSYEIGRVPRTLVGADALSRLAGALDDLEGESVVIVADVGVQSTGYVDRVVDALHGCRLHVHVVPSGEPTVDTVDAAAEAVRSHPEAVVLGVGGGSALDIAKQASVVSMGDTGVEPYLLCATALPGRRPIVAVPTTSGTGAEVTRTCIVTDRSGHKSWTWGDEMLPDLVVLDPTAASTMPHAVTVGTGLDAFVHAIEACSGQRRSSIATAPAQRALALVRTNLPAAAADGSDLVARQGMQEAAYLAGIAIDNCGTGVAHSIGHALGTLYHVPHGIAVATGLLAALRWNVDGAGDAYTDAAAAFACAVEEVPAVFAVLCAESRFDLARAKIDADMNADDIATTMIAIENQPMLQNNARPVDDDDRVQLARRTVGVWNVDRV